MSNLQGRRDEVLLPTFDQWRLPIYEKPKSLDAIRKYAIGSGKNKTVFPEHMMQLREVNMLVTALGNDCSFILLGRSLASTMNISTGMVKPPEVLFDACVISTDDSSFLLSFVNRGDKSTNAQVYNTAVARGVVDAVRTYSAETFALCNGTINIRDIESKVSYRSAVTDIKQHCSKLLNPYTLQMNVSKQKNVTSALVTSIAIMQPVVFDDDARFAPELHIMTYEQFCILTDCVDRVGSYEVEVETDFDLLSFTLELAKRLQRSSKITLIDKSRTVPKEVIKLEIVSDVMYKHPENSSGRSFQLEQHTGEMINTFTISTSEINIKRTHVIKVSGIPVTESREVQNPTAATRELLELYFESASRGTVDDVELNNDDHEALVHFSSLEDVDRVMMKKTHLLREKLLTVTRYCRGNQKDFESWIMDITDEKTVEVRGGHNIELETLKDYFEDEESGGSCVSDIRQHENCTFITFKTENEARQVCQNQHILDEHPLEVKQIVPKPKYEDRFYVSGLKSTTSTEAFRKFLQREITSTMEISFGKIEGTAIVKVLSPFLLNAVRKLCRVRPLEGRFLHISSIPISNCILVHGLKKIKSKDSLKYYFKHERSGNATKAKVSHVQLKEDEQSALIYFDSHEVINGILSQKTHEIHPGNTMHTSLFLEWIETDEHPEWKTEVQQFTLDSLDMHIVRFINESSKYTEELGRILQEKMTAYTWDSNGTAVVLYSLDKPRQTSDLLSWKREATKSFKTFYAAFSSHKINVPSHLLWEDVSQGIKALRKPSEDKCKLYECEDVCTIVVVGHESVAAAIADEIGKNTSALDEKQRLDTNKKTESLLNIDPLKLRYLEKTGYVSKIQSQFTSMKVCIDEDAVGLSGCYEDLTNVKIDIENELCKLVVATIPNVTKIQMSLPSDEFLSQYVDRKLTQLKQNLIGIWGTDGSSLKIIAQSDSDINEIVSVISDSLCEQVIPIVPEMAKLLQAKDWTDKKSELCTRQGVTISTDFDSSVLRISATKEDIAETVEHVTEFLSQRTIFMKSIKPRKGIFMFLATFCASKLKEIEIQTRTSINVQTSSFEVKGAEGDLCNALACLEQLGRETHHRSVNIIAKGSRKIVLSDKGKKYIDALQRRESCVVLEHLETVNQAISAEDDQSLRSITGEPVIIANVQLLGNKSLTLYRGDITELDVELLVNAASTDLHPKVGLSRYIFDKGGPLLMEDVENALKRKKEFRVGGTVVTGPGNLRCRYVAHAFNPFWSGGKNEEYDRLSDVVVKCLDDACIHNLISVALPALSTGTYSFPPREAAKTIVTAIRDYFDEMKNTANQSQKAPWSVDTVYICDNNVQKVRTFLEVIGEIFPPSTIQHKVGKDRLSLDIPLPKQGSPSEDAQGGPDCVTLHFYSDKEGNIDAAVSAIENYCQNLQEVKGIEDKMLKTLNEEQKSKINGAGLNYDVKIETQFRLGRIRIRGLAHDVEEAHSKIVNLLEGERTLRERLSPEYQWKYYEVADDGRQKMHDYEKETSYALERAYSERQLGFDIMINDENISHNFDEMLRSPVSDPSSQSPIIRKESFRGSHEFEPPDTWSSLSSDSVAVVLVDKNKEEFSELEQLLCGTDNILAIVKIERIQDKRMWMDFKSKQRLMSEQNSRPESVVLLWYESTRTNVERLYKVGDTYDDAYRQGVQFAVSLDYLLQNTSTDPDADGYRYLLQCRVIKGIPIQDVNNTQFPPRDTKRGIRYDSIVIRDIDDDQPVLYKIFNGTQVYPEYLITYTSE